MEEFPLGLVVSVLGIVVPLVAFFWEFVLVGRKRLGYRIQMDTPVTGEVESAHAGVLTQLRPEPGAQLGDLSIVLLRIENDGATTVDEHDYRVLEGVPAGLCVKFPQRRVIGMAVTELSDPGLDTSLNSASGVGVREAADRSCGIIDLPRVPLNRADHYKILAILERSTGSGEYPPPQVEGRIKGGRVHETASRTGPTARSLALIAFLVAVIAAQLIVDTLRQDPASLDCGAGHLTLTGSTAFAPVLEEAARTYRTSCPDMSFDFQFQGSDLGLRRLDESGRAHSPVPDLVSISDGPKRDGYPLLLPRPIAFTLFTLIANRDAGIADLTRAQIVDLYAGRVTNWRQLGGRDVPVRLVSRNPGSGTRQTFQHRILGDRWEAPPNSLDCLSVADPAAAAPPRCELATTADVLGTVARTPGALGYVELGAAHRDGTAAVRIDGHAATRDDAVHGAYPYWDTEYAYTHGELPANSPAAAFLRYLTNQVGRDVIRAHGNLPCQELTNPVTCQPG
ncbi:MAG: hypothetical protein HOQ24_10445 [Mycobacteriaceae bacterium]|nr:hypothetical protein [Mycobacteriaceae bacterium]